MLSILAGDGQEARSAYETFREVGARRADLESARPVVEEIRAKATGVREDVASAADEALELLDELTLRRRRTEE